MTRFSRLLLKKKAILIGTIKPFHSASLRLKRGRERTRRGTRLNFTPWPLNRIAQASQVQSSLRCATSIRWGWSGRKPTLHSSQRSSGRSRRANWRSVPKPSAVPVKWPALIVTKSLESSSVLLLVCAPRHLSRRRLNESSAAHQLVQRHKSGSRLFLKSFDYQ